MSRNDNFFNLNDSLLGIKRDLAPGLTARIFPGDQAMISVVDVEPHARGVDHSHPEEQWGVLLEGSGVRKQGGQSIPVREGDFWLTPGGVVHGFQAGPRGARLLDVFSPPRAEYRVDGAGFGGRPSR